MRYGYASTCCWGGELLSNNSNRRYIDELREVSAPSTPMANKARNRQKWRPTWRLGYTVVLAWKQQLSGGAIGQRSDWDIAKKRKGCVMLLGHMNTV